MAVVSVSMQAGMEQEYFKVKAGMQSSQTPVVVFALSSTDVEMWLERY